MKEEKTNNIKNPKNKREKAIKKSTKDNHEAVKTKYEDRPNLSVLSLYITIVNEGVGNSVCEILKMLGSSAQFISKGEGTASKDINQMLGIESSGKEVVFAFVRSNRLEEIEEEIAAFLKQSKKNRGLGFSIRLDSIIGIRIYKFLSQTL